MNRSDKAPLLLIGMILVFFLVLAMNAPTPSQEKTKQYSSCLAAQSVSVVDLKCNEIIKEKP